jgi:hypothetical protein
LFIEDVYSNARLQGRAEYILVDDLEKEEAFKVYDEFRFEGKEKIWEYVGGKIGDMIKLFEKKKRGYLEEEALRRILKDEVAHLDGILERMGSGRKMFYFRGENIMIDIDMIKEILKKFKNREKISKGEIDPIYRNYLVFENILFYNPLEGAVRPQSRLLWRAIREVMGNE